jgi:ribosomal protein L34E
MPITLEQLKANIEARRKDLPGIQRCAICDVPLQETITGNRKIDEGHVCSDCYFKLIGEELDEHPIAMPRTSRTT